MLIGTVITVPQLDLIMPFFSKLRIGSGRQSEGRDNDPSKHQAPHAKETKPQSSEKQSSADPKHVSSGKTPVSLKTSS